MNDTLEKDGDRLEQKFWPELRDSFPNYETLWQLLVVPLRQPGSIQLREDVKPWQEEMCMAHYSVFRHFAAARRLRAEETFAFFEAEEIFFHLGAATEMVERFILSVVRTWGEIETDKLVPKLDKNEYRERTRRYWKRGYKKAFRKFRKTGRSVWITLHDRGKIAKTFFCKICEHAKGDYKKWKTAADYIRTYRNAIAHNPRLVYHERVDRRLKVPKQDKLNEYARWSDLVYRRRDEDLIDLDRLIESCQTDLEHATNTLWAHLIEALPTLLPKDEHQPVESAQPVIATSDLVTRDRPDRFTSASGTSSALDRGY